MAGGLDMLGAIVFVLVALAVVLIYACRPRYMEVSPPKRTDEPTQWNARRLGSGYVEDTASPDFPTWTRWDYIQMLRQMEEQTRILKDMDSRAVERHALPKAPDRRGMAWEDILSINPFR